jgi:class 3 adenylate cyclase
MAALELEAIGERIRSRREKLRRTQRDVANALQVSGQAVSKWERGENAPDVGVLVDLARLLDVSVDWLLGGYTPDRDVIEATVLLSDVRGYGRKSDELSVADAATWLNGLLFQMTEAILRYDGITVKYMGDAVLAFFAGAEHRVRALRSAALAKRTMGDGVRVMMHAGEIYVGRIGHPDYAQMDILGPTVNIAASLGPYNRIAESNVVVTSTVLEGTGDEFEFGPGEEATFKFTDTRVTVHALIVPSAQ